MPTTDQDARALTYLARRLRDETHGAVAWDEAGTYAVVSRLVGQNLASAVERVTRHAADPAAKTPGAIQRPFIPDAQKPKWEPARGPWCGICGQASPENGGKCIGHDFERPTDRRLPADAMRDLMSELRDRLEPIAPPPEPRVVEPDPRVTAAREHLHDTTPATSPDHEEDA